MAASAVLVALAAPAVVSNQPIHFILNKKRVQSFATLDFFFVHLQSNMEKTKGKEHVILVDADYVDGVVSTLMRDFQNMLGHAIPLADMADWLICCALDAGVNVSASSQVQVIFVRSVKKLVMAGFNPGDLTTQLDGQAFRDERLGEFLLSTICDEQVNEGSPLTVQCVETLLSDKQTRTLTLVPDMQRYGQELMPLLQQEHDCQVTLLSMQPQPGERWNIVQLGYSLMHAMGIRSEEFK